MISCSPESLIAEEAAGYSYTGGPRVTYEEFLQLTKDSESRYELIDGEVFKLESPSYFHQTAVDEIYVNFHNWFKGEKCRPLTSPFDVTLNKLDDINVVQPDIIVICDTENIDEKGRYKGVPALVVEVLSPSTRDKDMMKKVNLFMWTGIKECWLVETDKREVYIYSFKDSKIKDYRVFTGDITVNSGVFEGLEIALPEIFTY